MKENIAIEEAPAPVSEMVPEAAPEPSPPAVSEASEEAPEDSPEDTAAAVHEAVSEAGEAEQSLGGMDSEDRLAESESGDDLLDIPAFLRRQAN